MPVRVTEMQYNISTQVLYLLTNTSYLLIFWLRLKREKKLSFRNIRASKSARRIGSTSYGEQKKKQKRPLEGCAPLYALAARLEDIIITIYCGGPCEQSLPKRHFIVHIYPGITLGDFLTRRRKNRQTFPTSQRRSFTTWPPVPLVSFSFCFLAFVFCPLPGDRFSYILLYIYIIIVFCTHVIPDSSSPSRIIICNDEDLLYIMFIYAV